MASERYTVLIVDDDEEIVDLLREYFRERNFEVISTTDLLKVVEALHAFSTKLLVLDLKMRDLDGFGVLEKSRGRAFLCLRRLLSPDISQSIKTGWSGMELMKMMSSKNRSVLTR